MVNFQNNSYHNIQIKSHIQNKNNLMKKIFRIALLELEIMFYSPIAWIILIIITVQTGLSFTEILYQQETNQQIGRNLTVLTRVLFAGDTGILALFQENIYLYIPLLTMGLISRELHSESIKLLLSSPVTSTQIVLGKYFSMMVYGLLLILVLTGFVFAGNISVEGFDPKFVLGGIFGIYLLICAYSAIGLFMSSLTSYQVVAVISTLAVLAGLNYVNTIGQSNDIIREITYWISISGRTDNFIGGLISSKDLFYFLLVIGLFLFLTIMKLDDERKTRPKAIKIFRYSFLLISVVFIGYITSLPYVNVYYDTSRFKESTLTDRSKEIIKQLNKPITITSYVNILDYSAGNGVPKNRIKDRNRFEMYRRFLPAMEMNYVYYYDTVRYYSNRDTLKTLVEKAKEAAKAHRFNFKKLLTPEEIKKVIDLAPEGNRLVRYINYGSKSTPLRMFDDIYQYPGEGEISAALKRLISGAGQVGILYGNGERNIHQSGDKAYKTIINGLNIRGSLINQGFESNEINLDLVDEIPLNLDVLILADPKHEYTDAEIQKIEQYIDAGGNMLIAGEPSRQFILNPITEKLGVKFSEGNLLQESENSELDLIHASFTPDADKFGFSFYDGAEITLPSAMKLAYKETSGFEITPILVTDIKTTWNKLENFDLNSSKIAFDSITENKITAPIALAVKRKMPNKEQKIIILGDADFMSNSELNRSNNVNASFTIRMFKWFSDGEYPISTKRPKAIDTKILLSRNEILWMKGIIVGVIPLLIGIFATVILFRRKRR